jgi:hypothetical protein
MVCACSLRTQQCADECQCQNIFGATASLFGGWLLLAAAFFRLWWSVFFAGLSFLLVIWLDVYD